MSHSTHPSALRPLAGAVLLAAAGLAAPAASHAQTSSEAALQNRLAPTVFIASAFDYGSGAATPVLPGAANGDRALLARIRIAHRGNPDPVPADAASASVDGAYAVLGRPALLDPRQRTIPAASR